MLDKPEDFHSVGVAGLGLLGQGIVRCLSKCGFAVVGLDSASVSSLADLPAFTLARSETDFSDCDFIIESISEDLAAKRALFQEIEACVGVDVPIVSNTSSIPITVLQSGTKNPKRFAGMHWTPPADTTPFLEVICGDLTDETTMSRVLSLGRRLGKEPGLVKKDLPGFVANRLAYALYREALYLLEEGVADIESIDLLCRHSLGLWMPFCGPFRWMDITGGPALYANAMQRIIPSLCSSNEVCETMLQMKEQDCRGTLNGKGFYDYEPSHQTKWQTKLEEHVRRLK